MGWRTAMESLKSSIPCPKHDPANGLPGTTIRSQNGNWLPNSHLAWGPSLPWSLFVSRPPRATVSRLFSGHISIESVGGPLHLRGLMTAPWRKLPLVAGTWPMDLAWFHLLWSHLLFSACTGLRLGIVKVRLGCLELNKGCGTVVSCSMGKSLVGPQGRAQNSCQSLPPTAS